MKKIALISTCLISFVLTTACAPVKATQVANYTLTGVNTKRVANQPTKKTILVSMPVASPGYQSQNMVYVNKPYQLNAFTHNNWVAPPAKMLMPLIVSSLRNTNEYHAVVSPPFSGLTVLRLDTQLLELQQNFSGQESKVEMILEAELVDNVSNKVLATKHFKVIVPTSADPYGGVVATNKATTRIMQQLASFAAKATPADNLGHNS